MHPILALIVASGAVAAQVSGPKLDVPPPPVRGDVEREEFVPYPAQEGEFADAALFEQWDPDTAFKRWRVSQATKNVDATELEGEDVEEWRYEGEWSVEPASVFPGFANDYGLVLKSAAAHHAISHKFDEPVDNTGKQLVVQYEVKTQQPLHCGGAYLKLLAAGTELNEAEFSNETPYVIMFGPDRCGVTDKVHFILKRHGGEEHHLVRPPRTRSGLLSTLYTLVINPDQTYEIRIDGMTAKAGDLRDEDTFNPPLNPPREIDDPSDSKPEDWVEDEFIPDPEQTVKPDDWDEEAPLKIPDPDAVKPEEWHEDVEPLIPDPEAEKPEDWDDEEDGEWIAPYVPNPECQDLDGCGPWSPPLIRNPSYRGKWTQPLVPNPEYIGEWEPRKIPNPEYIADERPADLDPIGGVGFELWTMQPDILFDNIYVGHSILEAENIGNATWNPKYYVEQAAQKAAKQSSQDAEPEYDSFKYEWKLFKQAPLQYIAWNYNEFVDDFSEDYAYAITAHPVAAALFAVLFAVLAAALFGIGNAVVSLITGKELPPIEQSRKEKAAKAAKASAAQAEANEATESREAASEADAPNTEEAASSAVNETKGLRKR